MTWKRPLAALLAVLLLAAPCARAVSYEDLDEETLNTLNKFFENNLNVSETSRQLFVHRNTLVYRIEKIQKSTGLDLRSFDDALTFKIALMVVNYMKYLDNQEY